jgi:hypothetical protein
VKRDGNGRGKFRHPAIVAGVHHIFYNDTVNTHLAKMSNSEGKRMKDQVPISAVVWVCMTV